MPTVASKAFIQSLTETDQLSPRERKQHSAEARSDARRVQRAERYEAWMIARAAFHHAEAASTIACLARMRSWPDAVELTAAHEVQARAFIPLMERFMLLPFLNLEDRKDRQVLTRRWASCAKGSAAWPLYVAARERWMLHLQSDDVLPEER